MNFTTALSNEQIASYAPSAMAIAPYHAQSDRYAFIPTSRVIDGMRDSGFLPVKASQSKSRIAGKSDFTKHMIRFRAADSLNRQSLVGDAIPEIVLVNSHDGTSAYKLFFGIFRLVCSNGMIVADSLLGSINIRHTGNIVKEVIEGSQNLIQSVPTVLDTVKKWETIELAPAESLALATAAHTYRFADAETQVTPERLLQTRRYADNGNDLWKTFNRVQENLTKGIRGRVDRSTGQRTGARGIKSIDGDVKLNRALWAMAEKLAEIKSA
jgi:hypothetical protein